MKATICDFCGKVSPVADTEAMFYDIGIWNAEDSKAESEEEKALMFSADDVCMDCTGKVRAALIELQVQLKGSAK